MSPVEFVIDSIGGDVLSSPLKCKVLYNNILEVYVASFVENPIEIPLLANAESIEEAIESFKLTVEDTISDMMSYPENFPEQAKKIEDLLRRN